MNKRQIQSRVRKPSTCFLVINLTRRKQKNTLVTGDQKNKYALKILKFSPTLAKVAEGKLFSQSLDALAIFTLLNLYARM